jgi:hypothetical protein
LQARTDKSKDRAAFVKSGGQILNQFGEDLVIFMIGFWSFQFQDAVPPAGVSFESCPSKYWNR